MAKINLPQEWQISYLKRSEYPENLIPTGTATYRSKLVSYRKRLDDAGSDLCLIDGDDQVDGMFDISVIDLESGDGRARDKRSLHSPSKLTRWLGVEEESDPNDVDEQQIVANKRDPRCRVVYIYAQNSRDKLNITRGSLAELMTYHQVMPAYLDFMMVFGAQSDPKDIRFLGFREQIRLKAPSKEQSIPALGRSGKIFQLCYSLRGVKFKKQSNENIKFDEWYIRKAALYHQFDVEYGTTLWMVTIGGNDILDLYKELTGPNGRPEDPDFSSPKSCFRSSLSTHLLFSHWAAEDWRWYVRWLEECLDYDSDGYAHKIFKLYDFQDIQHWQDKAAETAMILESNAKILSSIRRFYVDLIARKDFPSTLKTALEDDIVDFFAQLDEIINDFHMQIRCATLPVDIVKSRKELFLQYLQGQAAERTEQLNRKFERETVVMRIVTIVTLFYLPATFVSTFFSTDIVKYQESGGDPNGSFSALALTRWLQVTLPLTALTLLGAWFTYKNQFVDPDRGNATVLQRIKHHFSSTQTLKTGLVVDTPPQRFDDTA